MADDNNARSGAAAPPAAAPVVPPEAPPAENRYFKLPDFWSGSPAAWFGVAEAQFDLRGITTQRMRFGLVTSVLPESSARKVGQLLTTPSVNCYDDLKAALLSTHQLTEIQKSDRLFDMANLGARRPMDLLAEMIELVKPGEEKTQLFGMLFMRRLPPAVRAQLTEDDHTDLRSLAEKADRIAASLAKQSREAGLAAAVSGLSISDQDGENSPGEDGIIAAVQPPSRGRWDRGGRGGKFRGNSRGGRGGKRQARGQDNPIDVALSASGLCRGHFYYGDKAYNCKQPCNWQEN